MTAISSRLVTRVTKKQRQDALLPLSYRPTESHKPSAQFSYFDTNAKTKSEIAPAFAIFSLNPDLRSC